MSPPSWERRTRRRGKQHERLPVPNEKEGRTLGRPPSLNGPVGLETDRSYERPHRPVRGNERNLVLETILFPKQGQDVLLERLGELTGRVGLQMQRHITCVHISTPWLLRREPT